MCHDITQTGVVYVYGFSDMFGEVHDSCHLTGNKTPKISNMLRAPLITQFCWYETFQNRQLENYSAAIFWLE